MKVRPAGGGEVDPGLQAVALVKPISGGAHCARAVGRKMDAVSAHKPSAVAIGCVVVCWKGLVASYVTPPAPKGAVPAGVLRRSAGRK